MFLLRKKGEDNIIENSYSLPFKLDEGWSIVKAINIPRGAAIRPCSKRSVPMILKWYERRLSIAEAEFELLKKEYKQFKEEVGE